MKKYGTQFLFPLAALVILIFALSNSIFNAPPLGKFLDPFVGAVQNGESANNHPYHLNILEKGLKDSVNVFFDKRTVPHIIAKNTSDLYFTQGYVTASLRLWQMDFISYISAGRLSEIFGKNQFLDYDRNQRRIGILEAAKRSLKLIEKNQETYVMLSAYTKGVNAYINSITYKNIPFEYKLLDYLPEQWTNLKSVLVLKQLDNTLSGYEEDVFMSKMILALGEKNFNLLFPDFNTQITPVMNENKPLYTDNSLSKPDYLNFSFLSSNSVLSKSTYNPKLGSNSWAVSGKKTKSGKPILCSDPHLNLTLPCFWFEMQLTAPGVNVYGVSIPGSPAIIIGFNKNIAWGITNGADDARDWYKLQLSPDFKKYRFDEKWVDLSVRVEEIKRRDQKVFLDTVYSSVHGPIVNTKNFSKQPDHLNYALKWELHNASNEFLTFIKLNRAVNYEDYNEAIKSYHSPVQNFTFASSNDDIAINHQGNMPVKNKGQGKFILDGTKSSQIFKKYIPFDSLPHLFNPKSNYVLSANQHPAFANYPYYYNGYYSETRANQINKMLDKEQKFDISKMKSMQTDNTNFFAVEALPVLMRQIQMSYLSSNQSKEIAYLKTWNGVYDLNNQYAALFNLWWKYIKEYTFDELKSYDFNLRSPDDYALLKLIRDDPDNKYFDKVETNKKENAGEIISVAFKSAFTEYKSMTSKGQRWGELNKVNLMHLTNIPALSRMDISSAGCPDAINAMSSNWGPSWRMIVQLGERPLAYAIYPGGQSGNIGSPAYDEFINDWNHGKYYRLNYFLTKDEASRDCSISWSFNNQLN